MADLRLALIQSEDSIKKKLSTQSSGVDAGIWIEQMTSGANPGASTPANQPMPGMMMPGQRTMPPGMEFPGANPPAPQPVVNPTSQTTAAGTTNVITLVFRAVNLTSVDPSASSEIAYAVENEVKNLPLVDPAGTQLTGQITPDEATGTFTFTMSVTPRNPVNF